MLLSENFWCLLSRKPGVLTEGEQQRSESSRGKDGPPCGLGTCHLYAQFLLSSPTQTLQLPISQGDYPPWKGANLDGPSGVFFLHAPHFIEINITTTQVLFLWTSAFSFHSGDPSQELPQTSRLLSSAAQITKRPRECTRESPFLERGAFV